MDWTIFSFLLSDGLTNGIIYGLLALALVLTFTVTRVIAVFIGELLMFAPLSYVSLQNAQVPGTLWLSVLLLGVWAVLERQRRRYALALLALAAVLVALSLVAVQLSLSPLSWLLALAIVVPMGVAMFRIFYAPIPNASVLIRLILAVGLHFALEGLGLAFFGPEQFRVAPIMRGSLQLGAVPVSYQALFILAFALLALLALFLFFTRSLYGKALRASAVNRLGARISGISPSEAGQVAFGVASLIAAISGMLIAPLINSAYFMGFLLGLKGFVAAIIGGLASYPLTIVGALLVGLVEAFSAFYASAYKEAIVFALLLPALAYLSLTRVELTEEDD